MKEFKPLSQREYEIIDKVVNIINSSITIPCSLFVLHGGIIYEYSYSGTALYTDTHEDSDQRSGHSSAVLRKNDNDIWKGQRSLVRSMWCICP